MPEDDPNVPPLPGCFGCLGDIGPLVLAVLIFGGLAVMHRVERPQMLPLIHAAAPISRGDDSDVPPLQVCAPVAPRERGPAFRPEDDEGDIS